MKVDKRLARWAPLAMGVLILGVLGVEIFQDTPRDAREAPAAPTVDATTSDQALKAPPPPLTVQMNLSVSSGRTPTLSGTTNLPDGYVLAISMFSLGEAGNDIAYVPVKGGKFSTTFGANHVMDDGSIGLYPWRYDVFIGTGPNGEVPVNGPLTTGLDNDDTVVSVRKTLIVSDTGNRLAAPAPEDSPALHAAKNAMADLDVVLGQAVAVSNCQLRSPEWFHTMLDAYHMSLSNYTMTHRLNETDSHALDVYDQTLADRTTGALAGYHMQKCTKLANDPVLDQLDQIQYKVIGNYH